MLGVATSQQSQWGTHPLGMKIFLLIEIVGMAYTAVILLGWAAKNGEIPWLR